MCFFFSFIGIVVGGKDLTKEKEVAIFQQSFANEGDGLDLCLKLISIWKPVTFLNETEL